MARAAQKRRKTLIIIVAILASIIIYVIGLLSGLSYSKAIQQRTEENISFVVDYIATLDENLESIQLQEAFVNSFNAEDKCKFSDFYLSQIGSDLVYYWNVLPSRLEKYESDTPLSAEYLKLKEEYTKLSLRAWVIARSYYNNCETNIIPVLYFYSKDCKDCVKQGEVLDAIKEEYNSFNMTIRTFTLDLMSQEPAVKLIKEYYQINTAPAIIINEQVYQGRLYGVDELLLAVANKTNGGPE